MKILVVMPHFYPATVYGGPIISSYNTCQELAKLGHEVFVSTTNVNQNTKLDIETNVNIKISDNFNIKYYEETIANRFSCQMVRRLWSDIKSVDVVHIQYIFNYCTLVALYYAVLQRKKIILSPRGCLGEWCLNQGSRLKKIWNKIFIRSCAKKILWHATSEQEKFEIVKVFGKVPVFISPNGIDNDEFQSAVVLEKQEIIKKFIPSYPKSTYNKLIVSLGRLQKKKGYDILIKAFSESLIKFPDSILIIAGPDEGEKESLIEIVSKKKLTDNVYIIDSLFGQDKVNFLASADVFAMPSHNENFGNVYLESLAAGTPIIASVFTPWKLVEKYECGKWVEVDILEVSKALDEILMVNREFLRQQSLICAEEFSWAKSAKLISEAITS
ncbi:TPA: glycosyltransferase [Enterobacter mori]